MKFQFPTYEEMAKNVAEKALDEFLYDGRSIREWVQIIGSEDAISRQAVLDLTGKSDWFESSDDYNDFVIAVCELPPVNPQRMGHWIYDDIANNWRCDKCGETPKTMGYVGTDKFMAEHFKFCNHCGAKMEVKK